MAWPEFGESESTRRALVLPAASRGERHGGATLDQPSHPPARLARGLAIPTHRNVYDAPPSTPVRQPDPGPHAGPAHRPGRAICARTPVRYFLVGVGVRWDGASW